jgi:hypothetical protein
MKYQHKKISYFKLDVQPNDNGFIFFVFGFIFFLFLFNTRSGSDTSHLDATRS